MYRERPAENDQEHIEDREGKLSRLSAIAMDELRFVQ